MSKISGLSSSKEKEDYLKKCTVAIREHQTEADGTIGTGVIVTEDGLILTCYHIIGDIRNGKPYYKTVDLYFTEANVTKEAELIEEYCNPSLDVACLRLQAKDNRLPENSSIAYLNEIVNFEHKFKSFGFRKPKQFAGLFSDIEISGRIRATINGSSQDVLQLSSKEIEQGMSGAAVLDMETKTVVGIVFQHYDTRGTTSVDTNLNFAIPVKSILTIPGLESILPKTPLRWREGQELEEYLRYVEKQREYTSNIPDNKPLHKYYIPNSCISIDSLNLDDDQVVDEQGKHSSKGILELIDEYITGDDDE